MKLHLKFIVPIYSFIAKKKVQDLNYFCSKSTVRKKTDIENEIFNNKKNLRIINGDITCDMERVMDGNKLGIMSDTSSHAIVVSYVDP